MKKQTPGRPCGSSKNVKQDLMISAIKLFADNDFNSVSLKDIAKSCGTTSAIVHYYFGSKENLIDNIATDFLVPIFKEVLQSAINKNNPLDMAETVIDSVTVIAMKHPYIAKMWSKNFLHNDSNLAKHILPHIPFDKLAVFTEKIIQGQKDGIINKDLIPKLIYPVIISNIFIPISAFDFLLDVNSSSEKIKHIKSFILKGIRNE